MYSLFCPIVVFLFGLIVGSFLNCVIYRLAASERRASPSEAGRETGGSFLKGRSFCPHCKHTLALQDLIPVFSFIFLKGKCRYCGQKISWQYPIVEISTAILFLLMTEAKPLSPETGFLMVISCFLIVIFVYDLKHYIIPDKVVYPAIAITLIYNLQFTIYNQFSIFQFSIFSAVGAAAFFAAIVLISQGKWMGIGDIKLAFLMGLVLGWPNTFVALFPAFFIGAIIGVGLILVGKKKLSSAVPFGPFLVTGTILALFLGERIVDWYLTFFLLK